MSEILRLIIAVFDSRWRLGLFIFRKKSPYLNLLACLAICLLAGCDETTDCGAATPAQFTATFIKKGTTGGFGNDSVINFTNIKVSGSDSTYYEGAKISSVILPFNPASDTTTYLFYRAGVAQPDTIRLTYRRKYQLISPTCVPAIDFTNIILQDISPTLDSVTITNAPNDPK